MTRPRTSGLAWLDNLAETNPELYQRAAQAVLHVAEAYAAADEDTRRAMLADLRAIVRTAAGPAEA